MRILVVEDDDLIARGIASGLRAYGFAADTVPSAAQAELALANAECDAMVLDRGLPDGDGLSLLNRLRAGGSTLPVLLLTARDTVEDRIEGLQGGADDYLVKPFDLDELVARLQALLRRAAGRSHPLIEHGALCLDPVAREVTLRGRPVSLSRRELVLLEAFLQAPRSVLSADQLKDSLYGMSEDVESNALNVHIHHLRRKLGGEVIETVRGLGYRLGPPLGEGAGEARA